MKDRTYRILELLTSNKKMNVSDLSKELNVSQVTIRKDLDYLESKSIISREYGYAILQSTDDINGRIAYHYEEKKKIAAKASELVKDGDTIMIESGSCCALLAEHLTQTKKRLTIITNSAFIASYIRDKSDFEIVLLGGIYQKDAQVNVGSLISECVRNFLVDLFFIGTDGYDENAGFTNKNQMRAQAVRDMARQANKVIILTESDKFNKRGTVPLNISGKIKTIYTDSHIDQKRLEILKEDGISVVIAE